MNASKLVPLCVATLFIVAAAAQGGGPCNRLECRDVVAARGSTLHEIRAMDDRLNALAATLTAAPRDRSAAATALLVDELVIQARAIQDRVTSLHAMTMRHAAAHLAANGDAQAIAACPAMDPSTAVRQERAP